MRIVKYFLIIILPIVVILGNFQFLIFNFNFYQKLYSQLNVYQSFDSPNTVNNATQNLLGFYRGKNQLDHNFFSNQAVVHLTDVKRLIIFTSNFFYLSLVVTVALITFLVKAKQFWLLAKATLMASIATIAFILLFALGLFSYFNSIFNQFHQLLFVNNLWQFPPDDNLIKLFPADFFILFTRKLFQNIIIISAVLAVVSLILNKIYFSEGKLRN